MANWRSSINSASIGGNAIQLNIDLFAKTIMGVAGLSFFLISIVLFKSPFPAMLVFLSIAVLVVLCSKPKRLLLFLVIYSLVVKFLINDLGVPPIANYVCDALLLLTVFFSLRNHREGYVPHGRFRLLGLSIAVFWFVATISAALNDVSPMLYIWAVRNTFRVFGIMYCCVRLLDRRDVFRFLRFFVVLFWINVAVCTYQYFILGTDMDHTNGLFGTGAGANAMTIIMMCFITVVYLFGYSAHKIKLSGLLMTLAACCYLAAIAELKFYFVVLVILVALNILLNSPTLRTFIVLIIALTSLLIGIGLLEAYNPEFTGFYSFEGIVENNYEGGYGNSEGLNRLSAVKTLDDLFMDNSQKELLGYGFGAGQYTQFFESALYSTWGETLHWTWFTDAAIFLETGYLGLSIYVLMFVLIAFSSLHVPRSCSDDKWFLRACATVAVFCIILIVYNCSLTVDPTCYFIGVLLSFYYIFTAGDSNDVSQA